MSLILVADENRDVRLTLRQLLRRDDHTVVEAEDHDACLTAAAQWQPDLTILGSLLPDSLTVCAHLRAARVQMPILLVIEDDADAAERAFTAGASDIISAPIHWTVLRHRISNLLDVGAYANLLAREDWYHSVIENALEGIYRSSLEGHFQMVNPALVKMLGYDSAAEVLALDLSRDVHVSPEQRQQLVAALTDRDHVEIEAIWKKKNGDHMIVNLHTRVIRDARGNILYFEGKALDITEQKKAEAALLQSQEELQVKTESLQTIQTLADAVYDSLDVQTVIDNALDVLLAYFHVSGALVFLVDEEQQCLRRMAGRALPKALSEATECLPLDLPSTSAMSVKTRSLVVSDDGQLQANANPETREELAQEQVSHVVAVPLLYRGNAIGALTLPLHNNRVLTPHERETLLAAGKTIGLAIANARYVEQVEAEVQYQQRAEQAEREQRVLAEALRDTAAALNSKLDQNVILDRILELLRRVIPYDTANVILLEGNVLRAVRSVGYEEHGHYTPELFTVRYRLEETGNFLWMVNHRRGLAIPDVWAYEGWIKNVTTDWIRSHAGAPIEVDGEVIGFLNLDSAEPNTFDDNHADILKIFADQAGIAFRNARLYDEARRHAEVLEHRVAERTSELSIEKAKLQAILDGMADGVTAVTYAEAITIDNLWDLVPVFRYTNQVLYRMLSYPSDETEIDWLHAHTMTAEEYRVWRTDLVKGLLETNYWQGEITLCRSDGSQFECETTVTGIRDDDHDLIGSITIFRDVSQEKALEQRKARFISNAAHELRTPITNLKTRLYLAQKQPERMGVHLQILEQVTDHMKNLVEYLLDLSRLERGTVALQRERLNLADIVKQVVAIQEPEAAQRDLRLLLEPAPYSLEVYADPGRINQVITNLLSNAVHHTPPGGMVSVSLQQERIDGRDMACIEVCDTGVGIRPEHIPHIFQPFFQADNGSSGLGLGLSISKEIVDLHGGDIRVESVLGQGTCFSVTLPLAVEVGEVPDQKVDPI